MSPRRSLFLFLLLSLLLSACKPGGTATFAYQPTPVEGWDKTDSLTFSIDTVRAGGTYRLSVGLRTSASHAYPYRDITLQIVERISGQPQRVVHTNCHLTNAEGDISGTGIASYQYVFDIETVSLPEKSTGTITIRHLMRDPILSGITDVGVKLERE